ncbi:hypothetical protein WJX74_009086 [Apatococcus lobatus]|uniref:FAS1 domain-containing protein n=1 Tax=Apatococcus lobatus TaxID=904363 RepID=A0AAW1QHF2_9CHLO
MAVWGPTAFLLLTVLVQGVIGIGSGSLREVPTCQTALQTIQQNKQLDNFASILRQTRLAGLLDDPAFPATVFAVKNEALAGLSRLLSTNGSLATEQVKAIAHFHVLPFSLQKATRFNTTAKQFTTMLGQPIFLQQLPVPVVTGLLNSSALLTSKPMPACQAEVYLVDGVLLPDLRQVGNGSATRAAAQGLRSMRATPTRRLLARPEFTQSKAGNQLPATTVHSHASHTDVPQHHLHEGSAGVSHEGSAATGASSSHDPTTHHASASKSAGSVSSKAGSQLDATSADAASSLGGEIDKHTSSQATVESKKGAVSLKPEAGVSAEGKKSEKQQREAEAERQALAVPERTPQQTGSAGLSKASRPELSTLTTTGGEGMADSKHTTVSAGSRADKQEPKDELDSLGATTPDDLMEDGQVGAEATDPTKAAAEAAATNAAASKTLENDLEGVYSHSGGDKLGQKGSGVLKSIMGMFSPSDSSESQYKHNAGSSGDTSRSTHAHPSSKFLRGDTAGGSRQGEESEAW